MFTRITKFVVKPDHVGSVRNALLVRKASAEAARTVESIRLFFDETAQNEMYVYQRMADRWVTAPIDSGGGFDVSDDLLESAPTILNLNDTTPAPDHSNLGEAGDPLCWVFFFPKLKEGYHDQVVERFKTHVKLTREEPGNCILDMYTVEDDQNMLAVYELWRTRRDLDVVHFDLPFAKVTGKLLGEAVDGDIPSYIKYVTEIIA